MEFPGGNDHYLTISGAGHPFLSSAETFHTPSLGDEEFEIPPISLDPDPSLAVSDVGHFDELQDPALTAGGSVGADPVGYSAPFTSQGLEHLNMEGGGGELMGAALSMDLSHSLGSQYSSSSSMTIDVPLSDLNHHGLLGHGQLTTIDQSELTSQLGLSLGGGTIVPRPQSPEEPLSATPSPSSSLQEEAAEEFKRHIIVESPVTMSPGLLGVSEGGGGSVVVRRAKPPKKTKKKKKDPNEPQKPVSAYALFFRDTQAAIKGQNPSATFGEVSKIVASMWDSLGEEQKQVYKRKTEAAKKEYLKALAAYRANQVSQTAVEVMDTEPPSTPPPPAAPKQTRSHATSPSANTNTITNICTSNIILNHPQVITRSRTGAIAPSHPPLSSQSSPSQHTRTVTKIIISKQMLASSSHHQQIPTSVVTVIPASRGLQIQQTAPTVTPASNPRPFLSQPPPLQQMQQPPPPRLQQMVHTSQQLPPPPLQAKPRGAGLTITTAPPPPLQIKILPAPAPVSSPLQIQAQPVATVVSSPTTPPVLVSPPPPPPALIVGAVSASTASSSPPACLEVAQSVGGGPLISATSSSSPPPLPGAQMQEEAEDFNAGEVFMSRFSIIVIIAGFVGVQSSPQGSILFT
ncbi:TOX high mobility group box family member 4-like isoform X2 [Polyodon spathula]|uniref:TOX high mobility group box family member 4-like isoform X2 n=1 Tax=Polyodon spathula TaxID=7913 RepID=UPI001B7DC124|nr:TOX high mobility group box family member 4-like isoform X2 [Polyodon spathula]